MVSRIHSGDKQRSRGCRIHHLLLLILVAACGHGVPAEGHGDAEWIMNNPDYVDRLGRRCCGPKIASALPRVTFGKRGNSYTFCRPNRCSRRGIWASIKVAIAPGGGVSESRFRSVLPPLRFAYSSHSMGNSSNILRGSRCGQTRGRRDVLTTASALLRKRAQ
jgi:hypothetical protein